MAMDKSKFPWIDLVEQKVSGCLFMDTHSYPMWFTLCTKDIQFKEGLTKFIEFCGGRVCKSLSDMNPYAAVLVDDNCTFWSHPGDVFKISYIESCYTAHKCQDITNYRKNSDSRIVPGFNYMDIIYFKKYTWDMIPAEFIINIPKEDPIKKNDFVEESNEEEIVCDSSSDSVHVMDITKKKDLFLGPYDKQKKIPMSSNHQKVDDNANGNIEEATSSDTSCDSVSIIDEAKKESIILAKATSTSFDKHTRMWYSRNEREAILKFIVQDEDSIFRIKGNQLWKNMERAKVCKIRTWQSMKEHFLKKIIFELASYKFLTHTQVHDLKVAFTSK